MLDSEDEALGLAASAGPNVQLSRGQARTHIDELDIAIIGLLRTRRDVSRHIQQARLQAGGPRVDPGREADIAQVYRSFFGESGDEVAAAVLRVCRS